MTNADLEKSSVLVLNSLYQAIGTVSIKKSLVAMSAISDKDGYAAKAVDLQYQRNEDGTYNFDNVISFNLFSFEDWLFASAREGLDRVINTSKMQVRCPTVIVTSYSKMPMRRFRPTKGLLYEMQKGVCDYSGKKMPIKKMNLEHKVCKSHGGKDTFENLMLVDQEIDQKRGNKPLDEAGLKPLFKHNEPRPLPFSFTLKGELHPDWRYFINI